MSYQNMPWRNSLLGVSCKASTTAFNLQPLIEDMLGLTPGALATIWREVTIQVDPEANPNAQLRVGMANVGTSATGSSAIYNQGTITQKGETLPGGSSTFRGVWNNVPLNALFVQAVTGTVVFNVTALPL